MMNDAERRYMKARQKITESYINPLTEMMACHADVVAGLKRERDQAVTTMKVLRPVWAQGHTTDSMAAQAHGNALAEIWQILGVDNQTAAMARIRGLLG